MMLKQESASRSISAWFLPPQKAPPTKKRTSKEKDLIHPASLPPYGAGFQPNSIIDGSQSPQTALLCRCIVAWRRVAGSSGGRRNTRTGTCVRRGAGHTQQNPCMETYANAPDDVHASARHRCSQKGTKVPTEEPSADISGPQTEARGDKPLDTLYLTG